MDKNKRIVPTEWGPDVRLWTSESIEEGSEEHTIWKLKYASQEHWWKCFMEEAVNKIKKELD